MFITLCTPSGTQTVSADYPIQLEDYLGYDCRLTLDGKDISPEEKNVCFGCLGHGMCVNEAQEQHPLDHLLRIHVKLPLLGGKGGFGSALREQGNRMSRKAAKEHTYDCRDLQGRRIKTVKEAEALAEYVAKEPERKRQKVEKLDDKIQKTIQKTGNEKKIIFDDKEYLLNHEKVLHSVKNSLESALAKKKKQNEAIVWEESDEE